MNRKSLALSAALLVSLFFMSTLLGPAVVRGQTPESEPLVERMMRLAQEDPAALMEFLSTQDPAMVGAALNAFVVQNPGQVAATFAGLAQINPAVIGGILAAGPGSDPAVLAAIGQHMPVDAWMPEDVAPEGEDRHSAGFWYSMGSGGPIESALGKFSRTIPNARVTFSDIPTGTLANLTDLPEGFIVSSFISLSADGYLESDFVVGHVTFFLDKSWLQSNNIHEWTVHMSRFDEPTNSWSPVQAKRVREDESRVYFSVAISTFSKWVIGGFSGLTAPRFSIDELIVSGDAKTHQPVTVQVTATNLTPDDAHLSLPLWMNGQLVSIASERLGPDERRAVSFAVSPTNVGEAQVRVDRLVSTISVAEGPPPTPTPLPAGAAIEEFERGSGLQIGYIVGVVAAVVVGLTVVAGFTGSRRKGDS